MKKNHFYLLFFLEEYCETQNKKPLNFLKKYWYVFHNEKNLIFNQDRQYHGEDTWKFSLLTFH